MGCSSSSTNENTLTQEQKDNILETKENKGTINNDQDNKNNLEENNKSNNQEINTLKESRNKNQPKNIKKMNYNGVTLMQGIEDYFPEDIVEDDLYQMVEESLKDNIIDEEKTNSDNPKAITKKQVKVITSILYDRIKKGKNDNKGEIDINKYPELKGKNIRIGVRQFTKDVVKEYIYNNQNIDECQIDITYSNLTKDKEFINALTIEIN